MRQLSDHASIGSYLLDLVYLNGALTAADHLAQATRVQTEIDTLRGERGELERAEELEVVAQAFITIKDVVLDAALLEAAKFLRAHHPDQYSSVFSKAPSDVADDAYASEISEARTVVVRLDQLPDGDPVRVEFSPRVEAAASALESALKDKEELARAVGLVRLKLERRRASVNLLRTQIFGELLQITGSKKVANRFFRSKATTKNRESEVPTPPPNDPVTPPVVP